MPRLLLSTTAWIATLILRFRGFALLVVLIHVKVDIGSEPCLHRVYRALHGVPRPKAPLVKVLGIADLGPSIIHRPKILLNRIVVVGPGDV